MRNFWRDRGCIPVKAINAAGCRSRLGSYGFVMVLCCAVLFWVNREALFAALGQCREGWQQAVGRGRKKEEEGAKKMG